MSKAGAQYMCPTASLTPPPQTAHRVWGVQQSTKAAQQQGNIQLPHGTIVSYLTQACPRVDRRRVDIIHARPAQQANEGMLKDQKGVFQHTLACLREIDEILNVDHTQHVDVGTVERHDTYDSDD